MWTLRRNILECADDLQFCTGQRAGCKAAEDDSNGILLLDTDNAFNWINQNGYVAHNQIICLIIATYIINYYS